MRLQGSARLWQVGGNGPRCQRAVCAGECGLGGGDPAPPRLRGPWSLFGSATVCMGWGSPLSGDLEGYAGEGNW